MKQGWEIKKIRDICDKASSNIVQNKISELDGDYPVYGASGYVQNVDFFHRDSPYIGIVKDGAGVGRVNIYPAYSSLLGTLQYIIPKDGYLLEYVAYALKGLNLASYASGATIPHIYFKNYGETEISVAPLAEQEKIVAELDCLSGIIEKKKQQLKELDALAQSIFYTMFGDPITNEKGWEVKKLGEVAYIGLGFTHTPEYVDDGIAFLSVKDISGGEICWDNIKYISKEEYDSAPKGAKPNKGDIMFCRVGTMGKPVIVDTDIPFCTFVSLGYLHLLNNDMLNIYVKHWMQSYAFDAQVEENVKGVAIKNLNTGWLKTFNIQHPPIALQQEFAEKIEAIEKQKELIKQSITETETLFNSRMDYYFK